MFGLDESPGHGVRERRFEHPIGVVRAWDVPSDAPANRDGRPDTVFVLVHGLGTGARLFRGMATVLRPHGRVLVLDLPGFSTLPRPRKVMDITAFGRATADLLDSVGVEAPVVLVGHSMGCQVAVELVRHRPQFAGRVVLAAPVLPPDLQHGRPAVRAFLHDVPKERPGAAWYSVLGYLHSGAQWLLQTAPAVLRYPFEQRVAGLGGQLVVVRGEHDPLCPAPWAQQVATLSRADARVVTVPGAAHQLVVDHAGPVADAVLSLVDAPRHGGMVR